MRRQIVARLIQSVIVVLIVATISFFVVRLAPGKPFSYEDSRMSPALQEAWRERFGYDQPLWVQYGRYVSNVARGNLGYSVSKSADVKTVLASALPRTLLLAGLGLLFSLALGMAIGAMQAARRGGWFDRITSMGLIFFYSLPDFWAALMILLIFAFWWPILPTGNIVNPIMYEYLPPWRQFLDRLQHLVLPVVSLTLLSAASVARYQRAAMLEILPSDYLRTARAKGVPERTVVWRHALRTALAPMVTLLGLMLPAYLGGSVFIERVFSWPGMGMLAADAIAAKDYDVITASVIVGSIVVVIGNLIADLLHMAVDPRVRE